MDDIYQEFLLEAAEHPAHYGKLSVFDQVQEGKHASCGDSVQVWLKWEGETLVDIGWEGEGCIISQASMGLLSEFVIGKTKSELKKVGLVEMLELLHFDTISPGRLRCVVLGLETLQKTL